MLIRRATLDDIDAILRLQAQIHAEHLAWDAARWTMGLPIEAAYRAWLGTLVGGANDGCAVVASVDGRLTGYLVAEVEAESTRHWSPRAVYVHDLFVEPAARGRGVARALMEVLLAWATQTHPTLQLRLITAFRNEAARAFFERYGFRACAVEMIREV